jgi:hypothetical protein
MKDSVVNGILLGRAVAIYNVLVAREEKALAEFKKKNKSKVAKYEAIRKRSFSLLNAADASVDVAENIRIELVNEAINMGLLSGPKRPPLCTRQPKQFKDEKFSLQSGLYDPRKNDQYGGGIRGFLSRSKHPEYRDLLDSFNKLEVESALITEEDEVKALFRAFMNAPAPTI